MPHKNLAVLGVSKFNFEVAGGYPPNYCGQNPDTREPRRQERISRKHRLCYNSHAPSRRSRRNHSNHFLSLIQRNCDCLSICFGGFGSNLNYSQIRIHILPLLGQDRRKNDSTGHGATFCCRRNTVLAFRRHTFRSKPQLSPCGLKLSFSTSHFTCYIDR